MVFARSTVLRAPLASRFARPARSLQGASVQRWQRAAQRTSQRRHASGSAAHAMKQAGSDLPWLVGAIVVTIPSCWYLMQPSSDHGHGHGDHGDHDGHGVHGEAGDHETPEQQGDQEDAKEDVTEDAHDDAKENSQEQAKEDAKEDAQEDAQEEKPAPNVEPKERVTSGKRMDSDKVTETEGKDQITSGGNEMTKDTNKPTPEGEPATKDEEHIVETPENKGSVEGVRFKGATKQGGDDNMEPDTRKHIPDAKGGAKKRIDSGYGQDIGATNEPERDDKEGSAKDKAASSKEPLSQNQTSGKQHGLSNAPTRHSTDISSSPDKSKKGEGTAETAKLQGPVSPNRPPTENTEARGDDRQQ